MKYTMNKIFKEVPKSEIGHKQIFRISVKKVSESCYGIMEVKMGLTSLALRRIRKSGRQKGELKLILYL